MMKKDLHTVMDCPQTYKLSEFPFSLNQKFLSKFRFIPCQGSTNFVTLIKRCKKRARIAQVVEQRTENPRVGGSSPPPGIILLVK